MRKVLSILVIALLVFTLAACGNNASNNSGQSSGGTSSGTTGGGTSGGSSGGSTGGGTSSGGGSASGEPIKIGVISAYTGGAVGIGKPAGDGAKLAAKHLKEQGLNIELIVEDYETNDTKAVSLAKKLISEDKVVALAGAAQVSTTMAVREVALENNMILLANPPIPQFGDHIYGFNQGNDKVTQLIVDYLKANNITKVGWINARDAYGQDGLPYFEKAAESAGIQVVAHEEFDATATDMTVQLTKIRSANPEALIVWSRSPGAGIVVKNFVQLGMNIPMIHSNAVANAGFLEQIGPEGAGTMVVGDKLTVYHDLPESELRQRLESFAKEYEQEFGYGASTMSMQLYDGLMVIGEAIKAGHTTTEAISNYIVNEMPPYHGLQGVYDFSPDDHAPLDASGLAIIKASTNAKVNATENMGWELVMTY